MIRLKLIYRLLLPLTAILVFPGPTIANTAEPPFLQLANVYDDNVNLKDYWVSEKLDGVRAYWNGKQLISRQGNRIQAPQWFIQNFPHEALDGELWMGHNQFELVSGIVRQQKPNNSQWRLIRYMVFDMPKNPAVYTARFAALQKLIASINSPYLQCIPQIKIENHQRLMEQLNIIVKQGGEGLMLHRGESHYQALRNNDLLKVKAFADAEATVIAHIGGKGKYKGMLGALLVENTDKLRFKIGSGFSDAQRKNPPGIGSIISYKYFGKTKTNLPRFVSFIRVRHDLTPFN